MGSSPFNHNSGSLLGLGSHLADSSPTLNPAGDVCRQLLQLAADLQDKLGEKEELEVTVNFGAIRVHAESLEYVRPNLVVVRGADIAGAPHVVAFHYSQVQMCFRTRSVNQVPARRMGFREMIVSDEG